MPQSPTHLNRLEEPRLPGWDADPSPPPFRKRAWVEVDLDALENNFRLIRAHLPPSVKWITVLKDDAYGHGAVPAARLAAKCGAAMIAVSNLEEALALRREGIQTPILIFGETHPEEAPCYLEHNLRPSVTTSEAGAWFDREARRRGVRLPVHVKVETGMGRYGVRWTEAIELFRKLRDRPGILLEGVYSHFARSDEADKEFARLQLSRFKETLEAAAREGMRFPLRHICNTGGFLDLPEAHLDAVRVGILHTGVYPSAVCRRLPGLRPAMSVKARVAAIRQMEPGDNVGYGLRYQCPSPRRIAVIPVGYGDGYPRVRNEGWVLIHGRRAPVVGANAMDATMVDVTDIPEARVWDEATLLGKQGEEEITAHDIARWKGTISYEVLVGWRERLPRVYVSGKKNA